MFYGPPCTGSVQDVAYTRLRYKLCSQLNNIYLSYNTRCIIFALNVEFIYRAICFTQ